MTSKDTVRGVVTEALPQTMFRVEILAFPAPKVANYDGQIGGEPNVRQSVLCVLSGKMYLNKIRVVPGDRVEVVLAPDGGRGRITKRL